MAKSCLSRYVYGSLFTDHRYPDLPRIGHLCLYLLCHFKAEFFAFSICDLVSFHDNAEFPARLNSVCLFYTIVGHGQVFKVLDPLDVLLHDLAAGTWTRTADGVAGLDDGRNHVLHLSHRGGLQWH